jgi:hypothetical protein
MVPPMMSRKNETGMQLTFIRSPLECGRFLSSLQCAACDPMLSSCGPGRCAYTRQRSAAQFPGTRWPRLHFRCVGLPVPSAVSRRGAHRAHAQRAFEKKRRRPGSGSASSGGARSRTRQATPRLGPAAATQDIPALWKRVPTLRRADADRRPVAVQYQT